MSDDARPLMYHELAGWFHLVTAPADYAEEAAFYFKAVTELLGRTPRSWLELGSGGGNNASHYAAWVDGEVVLSDRSPEMLALSRTLNRNLEHVLGDMLTIRLGRTFDVVFVHDAASYLTTDEQVRQLARTAFLHCDPGGATLMCPDNTAENLAAETDHGGHDGAGRALRYLEWTIPGPPGAHTYTTDYAYLLHEDGKPPRVLLDRHLCGALPRETWLSALRDAGFTDAQGKYLEHSEVDEHTYEMFFAGRRT